MGPHVRRLRPFAAALFAALLFTGALIPKAHALGGAEPALDASALAELEQRAATAQPKDRCFLYSEALHGWTELVGRSMADGDDKAASEALAHADADVEQLKSTLGGDAKRLKNAELLLEHTARRLSDMVRVASMAQHDTMQSVLKHLNSVHDALLAQLFAH